MPVSSATVTALSLAEEYGRKPETVKAWIRRHLTRGAGYDHLAGMMVLTELGELAVRAYLDTTQPAATAATGNGLSPVTEPATTKRDTATERGDIDALVAALQAEQALRVATMQHTIDAQAEELAALRVELGQAQEHAGYEQGRAAVLEQRLVAAEHRLGDVWAWWGRLAAWRRWRLAPPPVDDAGQGRLPG